MLTHVYGEKIMFGASVCEWWKVFWVV